MGLDCGAELRAAVIVKERVYEGNLGCDRQGR